MMHLGSVISSLREAQAHRIMAQQIRAYPTMDPLVLKGAAFHLAMMAEMTLKSLIVGSTKDGTCPPIHNHRELANRCGQLGVSIPAAVRKLLPLLIRYEANTRYTDGFIVKPSEMDEAYTQLVKWWDMLYTDVLNETATILLRELPESVRSMYPSIESMVIDNLASLNTLT